MERDIDYLVLWVESGIDQLEKEEGALTEERVKEIVKRDIGGIFGITDIEIRRVANIILSKRITAIESVMISDNDDPEWFTNRKGHDDYWRRYSRYLKETGFDELTINNLDVTLNKIMNNIGNPNRESFHKKGLAIGDIQSGKTSTYIGLWSKAADAGYKIFILLSGVSEDLREQTQKRIEEGFGGKDTSVINGGDARIGVGQDGNRFFADSLTTRKNDFSKQSGTSIEFNGKVVPTFFCIKKNAGILDALIKWFETSGNGQTLKLPLLLVDDEADNASVNTNKKNKTPTKINRSIRKLLNLFEKSSYVGFTATPFANVFIDPEDDDEMYKQDLFPSDFITILPTPKKYLGAYMLFDKDNEELSDSVKYITDIEEDDYITEEGPFGYKHSKEWNGTLPDSLFDAIRTFYLVNAIRDLRGEIKAPRTMMINISRFINVQKYIKECISEFHERVMESLKYNLPNGDISEKEMRQALKDPIINELYETYLEEFFDEKYNFNWNQIASTIYESNKNIEILNINQGSKDKLKYKDGSKVIAIGGLTLSRGITLEGLVVTYFYRNTHTYDVLMQMGRWFGYRDKYKDLIRIWIGEDSAIWFYEIAKATKQLKEDMKTMERVGKHPKEFGIRVRKSSSELKPTADNKMRHAKTVLDMKNYFGKSVETPNIYKNQETQKKNLAAVDRLFSRCESSNLKLRRVKTRSRTENYVFFDVPSVFICDFLDEIEISGLNKKFVPKMIKDFIQKYPNELKKFNVGIVEGDKPELTFEFHGKKIKRPYRSVMVDLENIKVSGSHGRLGGPNDEIIGLSDFNGMTKEQILEKAQAEAKESNTSLEYKYFGLIGDRNPLLLIYFLDVRIKDDKEKTKELRVDLGGLPAVGFLMGFPRNNKYLIKEYDEYAVNENADYFAKEESEENE